MKKQVTEWLDDMDGRPADETVPLTVDGVEYLIDLTAENAARLRNDLEKYLEAASYKRKLGGAMRGRGVPRRNHSNRASSNGDGNARKTGSSNQRVAARSGSTKHPNAVGRTLAGEMRAWAKSQTPPMPVSAKGRIPVPVQRAFRAAHGKAH